MLKQMLNRFGFFKKEQLTTNAWCGCCGKPLPNTIVEKSWSWDICKDCMEK